MPRLIGFLVAAALGLIAGCTDPADSSSIVEPESIDEMFESDIADIDPGDATEAELEVLSLVSRATSLYRDVDISKTFTIDATFDTGMLGVWEGRAEIAEGLGRWSSTRYLGDMRDFTRTGERLVFNWGVQRRTLAGGGPGVENQGVEAVFDSGLIRLLEVTSAAVPYCIGETTSGCKDYETGDVTPLDPGPTP